MRTQNKKTSYFLSILEYSGAINYEKRSIFNNNQKTFLGIPSLITLISSIK